MTQLGRFKPALISKGLRLSRILALLNASLLQASPDFKGIKTRPACAHRSPWRFKPALISKGLRPSSWWRTLRGFRLQASPDFKGIKTLTCAANVLRALLQASPDFKGIKTLQRPFPLAACWRFKPALISKGLRRFSPRDLKFLDLLQASPDFKGIKTQPTAHGHCP